MRHIILGTAGHIDHGKSTLVKALTGTDPDRLKEEKERGITIDLGFANMSYDGLTVGIVDVPGHEKLIKNMLAGAGGIDMVLLTIAADEGIMPQTREHLAICNLLGIEAGLTVITKMDLVDDEFLEIVIEEAREFVKGSFLQNSEIIPISAKTTQNMDLLREKIKQTAMATTQKSSGGAFRLPVDRVFTLKGFGTVVTGTALSGTINIDEIMEILPSGLKAKVRGLHSHGSHIKQGAAGQRIAINLQGIDKNALKRGDCVVKEKTFKPTQKVNVLLKLLKTAQALKTGTVVHFHLGTSETTARLVLYETPKLLPGETAFCQLRLKDPVVAVNKDKFIIRRLSPLETIGGGILLDPLPSKKKQADDIKSLNIYLNGKLTEKIIEKIRQSSTDGMTISMLKGWINEEIKAIENTVAGLISSGQLTESHETLFQKQVLDNIQKKIIEHMRVFHKKNPLRLGIEKEELKAQFKHIDSRLLLMLLADTNNFIIEKELLRLREFKPKLTSIDESLKTKILTILKDAAFLPPPKQEITKSLSIKESQTDDLLRFLIKEGSVIRINDAIYLLKELYNEMIKKLKEYHNKNTDVITVGEFRDMINTSRKYALPYLEYLDSQKITLRIGDKRKIMPVLFKV
ncbi:MAG: selenocysteine-specific translation elongation factor [Candidatus Magnetoovum sp. WYHC-5]|nr:selenocysteine-specific translation elongation factor [Candidatus Magnetoovum sp. WYHC-5]